ncbi:ATPase [Gudongella sp. SC589]|jgi:vacuolar-type H+-ATPase subunit H|uniref:ATPase n=1 Tax=Gudongella sp. SC589 TaxID=3385990 RepID=UPI0039047856
MDLLNLIDEVEDIVEAGTGVPLTGKVMIDKDELLDIIKEIRIKLPDEIKQAAWIKEERQRIIDEAQKTSNAMISEAENRLEELIDREEVIKQANQRAEEILKRAELSSEEIRNGALEYADELLYEAQENFKELIQLLNDNRKELRSKE